MKAGGQSLTFTPAVIMLHVCGGRRPCLPVTTSGLLRRKRLYQPLPNSGARVVAFAQYTCRLRGVSFTNTRQGCFLRAYTGGCENQSEVLNASK